MKRKIPQLPLDILLVIWSFCNYLTKFRLAFMTKTLSCHPTFLEFKTNNPVINLFNNNSKRVKRIVKMIENLTIDDQNLYLRIGEFETINLADKNCGKYTTIYSGHYFRYPQLAPRCMRGANTPYGHLVIISRKDKKENKSIRHILKKLKIGYSHRNNNIIVIINAVGGKCHFELQNVFRYLFINLEVF